MCAKLSYIYLLLSNCRSQQKWDVNVSHGKSEVMYANSKPIVCVLKLKLHLAPAVIELQDKKAGNIINRK